MRDTDASLAADTFGPPRVKDGDHEMQRLKMELLKIKCELGESILYFFQIFSPRIIYFQFHVHYFLSSVTLKKIIL